MGAWGMGNFENDDALDWVAELENAEDAAVVEDALNLVAHLGEAYLEAHHACRALAAAEVVAVLNAAGSPDLPLEVRQWVSLHPQSRSDLVQLALAAIHRIKTDSELKELWDESGDSARWFEVIGDLEARLSRHG